MERDCEHCTHHIGGSCDQWDCDFETTQSERNQVIDDFASAIKEEDEKEPLVLDMDVIEEIAERLKGGD